MPTLVTLMSAAYKAAGQLSCLISGSALAALHEEAAASCAVVTVFSYC